MTVFMSTISFIAGLCLGSFFNVLIYRLPRDESLITPGSHCPFCNHPVSFYDNIPVLSFLVLGGKCRHCRENISIRYPATELASGLLALALWNFYVFPEVYKSTDTFQTIIIFFQALTLLFLVPIAIIDAKHFIIPDVFTIPGLIAAIAASLLRGGLSPLDSIIGAVAGGGSLCAAGIIGKIFTKKDNAMGGGDIRLMAFAGALFGWKIALLSIFTASVAGSIAGLILLVSKNMKADHRLPFGPFLAAGILFSVMTINRLSELYIQWLDNIINN
jgi:leader peptidase (prepilin peptidase) / N-methyltransferase